MQNNDTFHDQCMFKLLKTGIRVGVEHVLVERFGVQVLIEKSEELLRPVAKVLSLILQLEQNVMICFRIYRGGVHLQ